MASEIKEIALCHAVKAGGILLLKSDKEPYMGRWSAPQGMINSGESPAKAAMRSIYQQTGILPTKVTFHGTIRLFLNNSNEYTYKIHVFSTRLFTGSLKSNVDGEAKWFDMSEVPYHDMWPDDKYWTSLVMQGKRFDADFFLDEHNEKVTKYQIREKKEILRKALPIALILVILASVGYGIAASGVLSGIGHGHVQTTLRTTIPPFSPSNTTTTSSRSTTTSTISTTTTIPKPTDITIDNLNMIMNYSGPSMKNGVDCNVPSRSVVVPFRHVFNSSDFYVNATFIDSGCPETITSIYALTPGASVVSTEPLLPFNFPAQSQIYFQIRVHMSNTSYTGPLTLVENYQ